MDDSKNDDLTHRVTPIAPNETTASGAPRRVRQRPVEMRPAAATRLKLVAGLPKVYITNRPLRNITAEAVAALETANDPPKLFVQGGRLTRIRTDEYGQPVVEAVSESAMRYLIARSAECVIATKNGDVPKAPPAHLVQDVMACPAWPFPPLVGVTEVPVLRADGSVLACPGYDPATGLIYLPHPTLNMPSVPAVPTMTERENAMAMVKDILVDFPFVDGAAFANYVGLLLTPTVRPAIHGPVPLALVDKPKAGTGATLLSKVVSVIATGRSAAIMTAPRYEEEWRKVLTATLTTGTSIIVVDNVDGPLRSGTLAACLTSTVWTDRLLGRNDVKVTVPQRAVWLATGNNLEVAGDLARRSYWIRLDAKAAQPWRRDGFRHPQLEEYVTAHRGALLAALLTLARAWYVAGCPPATVPVMGGFEHWSRLVGAILQHAGIEGFLGNLKALYDEADDESRAWEGFLAAWRDRFGEVPVLVRDLDVEVNQADSALRAALPDELKKALGHPNRSFSLALGNALKKKKDTMYGNLRLRREALADAHAKVNRWSVEVCDLAGTAGTAGTVYAQSESACDVSSVIGWNSYPQHPQSLQTEWARPEREPGEEG